MMTRIPLFLTLAALLGASLPALAQDGAPGARPYRGGRPGGPPGMPTGGQPNAAAPAPVDEKPEVLLEDTDKLTLKDVEGKLQQSLDPVSSYDLMLYRYDLVNQMNVALNGGVATDSASSSSRPSGPGPRRR